MIDEKNVTMYNAYMVTVERNYHTRSEIIGVCNVGKDVSEERH